MTENWTAACGVCIQCKVGVVRDDAIGPITEHGWTMCHACFQRINGRKPAAEAMPLHLRRQVESLLREVSGA